MTVQVQRCRYAVIKYAHDPLRQEPINVGVVIWSVNDPKVARWRFDSAMKRVEKLYPSANPRAVRTALAAFKQMIDADPAALAAGIGGTGSILMTEPRGVHCADMDVEIGDLYETLVVPSESDTEEPREKNRSSRFIKGKMNDIFKRIGAINALSSERAQKLRIVECKSGVKHTFDFAYQNGAIHRIDALSFDHGSNPERLNRARSFANLVEDVMGSPGGGGTIEAVIQIPTEPFEMDVYQEAKKILDPLPMKRIEVVTDGDLERFCAATKQQLHT